LRLGNLDLNLLVALDALLSERSVSIAANRMNMSQSAMSSALSRLRTFFDDQLLINTGRTMLLTARAEELRETVRDVIKRIENSVIQSQKFNPATAIRHYTIISSDYTREVLLIDALRRLAKIAPFIDFQLLDIEDRPIDLLESREADVLITLDTSLSDAHPQENLFDDDYHVICWKDNSIIGDKIDLETYVNLGHVCVHFGKARVPAGEEFLLKIHNVKRRIEIIAPSFTSVPAFLIGNDRIATMPTRLAKRMMAQYPLKMLETPIKIPKITQAIQWHSSALKDEALAWVIMNIREGINP
jgi:LysR family nod box-dependent transcriptional activator